MSLSVSFVFGELEFNGSDGVVMELWLLSFTFMSTEVEWLTLVVTIDVGMLLVVVVVDVVRDREELVSFE